MKLSTKGIISVAVLLASSLKINAFPIELKGVDKAVHIGQVNNHVREEFIEIKENEEVIDIEPYGPLFDLVCQSDLSDWCVQYPEQCSYVKTLCVKNKNDSYCAFDIYKKYIEVTNNNANALNSYMDLCDECLVEMSSVFQVVSNDKEAVDEIKTVSEMCKVKLLMDTIVNDENSNEKEVLSTLASLAPDDIKSRSKRHYGKIHSFKNPDVSGFVKSNGKIKYGNVGINEKVNTSIHNKNLRSSQMNKREEDEDVNMVMNFKEKLTTALYDIKTLAIQKVTNSFTNLEVNINVLLEDNLFISDPEGNREKNVLTEEILNNIKNILNSDGPDLNESETETVGAEEPADIPTEVVELFESLPIEIIASRKKSSLEGVFQIDESEENEVYIAEAATTAVSSEEEEEEEETTIPVNKEETVDDEEATDLVPVPDDGEEGDDEEEVNKEESATENTDTEEEEEEEKEEGEEEEGEGKEEEEDIPPPPFQGPPDVQPEVPKITPSKPSKPYPIGRPGQSWKFGWPVKTTPTQNNHGGKPSILQTINKLIGDAHTLQNSKYPNSHNNNNNNNNNNNYHNNYYNNNRPVRYPGHPYMPMKKWFMKKRNYVVSNELLKEREGGEEEVMNEEAIEEEIKIQLDTIEDDMPAETIKMNNPENHRDNNDDEEVFEIGAKKVSVVNNIRPVKPTLNFRKNDKRRDTH